MDNKKNNKINQIIIYTKENKINSIKIIINNNKKEKKRLIFQKGNSILKSQSYFILNIILSFMNIFIILCEFNQENILSKLSEVTLKVTGIGKIKLFSDYFFGQYNNCKIYINNTFFPCKK